MSVDRQEDSQHKGHICLKEKVQQRPMSLIMRVEVLRGPWGRNKPVNPRHQLGVGRGRMGSGGHHRGSAGSGPKLRGVLGRDANSAKRGSTEEVKVKGGTVSLNSKV